MQLSVTDVCYLTERHERTVREWIRMRRLPARKHGRNWIIELADLKRMDAVMLHPQRLLELMDRQQARSILDLLAHLELRFNREGAQRTQQGQDLAARLNRQLKQLQDEMEFLSAQVVAMGRELVTSRKLFRELLGYDPYAPNEAS